MTANEKTIRFTPELLQRPRVGGIDVVTTLRHFAIVTYAVDPERVQPHVDPRFELECFPGSPAASQVDAAGSRALVSMVPFEDRDFCFVRMPWPKFRFGQTNYRTYVIDRETGKRAVWFFGTTLDSLTVNIPRFIWRLPWHPGHMEFDCEFNQEEHRYRKYRMTTQAKWAPVELELEDTGRPVTELEGWSDLESAWVILTHPLLGVFYRRDRKLGTYRIWHDRLKMTEGRCVKARIGLFDRLGIVPFADQSNPHSVLLQHETEFTIYLPPHRWTKQ